MISQEGENAWKQFFCPTFPSQHTIAVPPQWAGFFTAILLSPADFEWARAVLHSKLWNLIHEGYQSDFLGEYAIPSTCPSAKPPACVLSAAVQKISRGFSTPQASRSITAPTVELLTTSMVHNRKRQKKTPLVISKVRRSDRLKLLQKGHKAKTCFDKNCLGIFIKNLVCLLLSHPAQALHLKLVMSMTKIRRRRKPKGRSDGHVIRSLEGFRQYLLLSSFAFMQNTKECFGFICPDFYQFQTLIICNPCYLETCFGCICGYLLTNPTCPF